VCGNPTRREMIRRLAALGVCLSAATALLPQRQVAAAQAVGGDIEAAKKEGKLVFWHSEQEADVVKFAKVFSDKYGIKTEWERLLPGKALPKLEAGLKSNSLDLDLWWVSDAGIMYEQQQKGRLLQYVSPHMKDYGPEFKSSPEGYWTTYFFQCGPIMWSSKFVKQEDAPKKWLDLLDPKWKGQVGFQDSTSGSMYNWWYLLRDIVPKDYFDRLVKNQPRAYGSSTQLMDDVQRGEIKIGGRVSIFQYIKALRANQPVEMVLPSEGNPNNIQVVGILAGTKRPNAAKVFLDYFLSQEGQKAWNEIQGSWSARKDVTIEGLPPIGSFKLLYPKDIADYGSPGRHQEFVKLWNQVTGFK
jgi:iron(III) transport system substrate-binding protein